ncbi:DUF2589 domain-containing protein [Actinoplanes sp. NPDC049316]|uniref:DUF2589 domain-containing protein n=1 Tax=Actinoplanes sp. NPDC049316 TaxID=3154727 RepID=UPI003439CE0E
MTTSQTPDRDNVGATTPAAAEGSAVEPMADPAAADLAEATADAGEAAARLGTTLAATAAAPQALAAPQTNFTSELNNIDFRKMIGGPLQAAVDAQVASSLATVDFINKVGFTQAVDDNNQPIEGKRDLVMVDFSHRRKDLNGSKDPVEKEVFVRVPLLAMLPIPSLRIEQVVIDFNVKLNSVESASTSDQLDVGAEVKAGWGPVNFKVSASYQRKTATNVEVKKEYALNVNVKAVQDEIPAGLEKILGILSA